MYIKIYEGTFVFRLENGCLQKNFHGSMLIHLFVNQEGHMGKDS